MMVDRYDLGFNHDEHGMTMSFLDCDTGTYVLYEDYETLLTKCGVKDKEIERLRSVMQEKNDALSKARIALAEHRDVASGKQR